MLKAIIVINLSLIGAVLCFSSGAPSQQCGMLTPNHGANASTSESPYEVVVHGELDSYGEVTVLNGGSVRLTLRKKSTFQNSEGFEGFIMVSEINKSTTKAGSFAFDIPLLQSICENGSGVTHTSGVEKDNIELRWVAPPAPFTGSIVLWATFVQHKTIWWKEIQGSVKIYVANAATTPGAVQNPPNQTETVAPEQDFVPQESVNVGTAPQPDSTVANNVQPDITTTEEIFEEITDSTHDHSMHDTSKPATEKTPSTTTEMHKPPRAGPKSPAVGASQTKNGGSYISGAVGVLLAGVLYQLC